MNLMFDLSIVQNCVLQIKDTTREENPLEYLSEQSTAYVTPSQFKYSDTYTINVIKYKQYTSDNEEIIETIITSHLDEDGNIIYLDEAYHTLQKDGHYIIDHIVLPSIKTAELLIELEQDNATGVHGINNYENFYATDGKDFYKYVNLKPEKCSIEEIMHNTQSNISKTSQETFSICFLHKCYLEHCKKEFNAMIKDRCAHVNYETNYISDLIWISINAIKYNIEFGRLSQAQLILEDLLRCASFCKPIKYNHNDCDCCK